MPSTCRNFESLHYLDSWNKHCGGSWWEFSSRTITLTDSILLAYAGIRINQAGKFVGKSFGSSLIVKSGNDIYEAWTGKRGLVRNAFGDKAYLAIDAALISYGFLKKIPKINYLGNPKRDFFTKDPLSYEYAFKQYSKFELFHLTISTSMTAYNNFGSKLDTEAAWQKHLDQVYIDAE